MVVRHPALELLVQRVGGVLADSDHRGADLGQPADEVALGRWKERLDEDDVHSRMIPCRLSPSTGSGRRLSTSSGSSPSNVPSWWSLRLSHLSCSRQLRDSSPRRLRCRTSASAVITAEPAERLSPELKQLLDGHWRVDDALDPQQIVEAVRGLSQQMGPVRATDRRARAAAGAAWRTRARCSASTGMDVRNRAERTRQVPDEVGAPSRWRALCPAPAGHRAPARRWRSPRRSASRWWPSLRPVPERRRRTGSMTWRRCAAGSRRFRRAPRNPGCSRSSWSATSTRSTA